MRSGCVLPLAVPALLLLGAPCARAQERRERLVADLNFVLGEKVLDREGWGDVHRQFVTGLETRWAGPGWPVSIATDVLFANASRSRGTPSQPAQIRGSTVEAAVGLRAVLPAGRIRFCPAGGLELAQGDRQLLRRFGPDDAAGAGGFGFWAAGGVFARLGQTANLGLTVRGSRARVRSGRFDVDAGGLAYGILLGFGIPASRPPESGTGAR